MLKATYLSLITRTQIDSDLLGRTVYFEDVYKPAQVKLAIKRVNAGMEVLDSQIPDWLDKINPLKLKLSDGQFCIVGQVCGGYGETKVAFLAGLTDSEEEYKDLIDASYDPDQSNTIQELARRAYRLLQPKVGSAEANLGFMSDDKVDFELLDVVWVSALRKRQLHNGSKALLKVPA